MAAVLPQSTAPSIPRELGFLEDVVTQNEICFRVSDLGKSIVARMAQTKQLTNKSFHLNKLLPHDTQAVSTMLELALHPPLLATVIRYFGTVPVLGDMDFFYSLAIPDDQPFSRSQLYHCDDTSATQLKVFVYCDDVDDASGPFELIDAATSSRARAQIGYRFAGRRYRVSDAEMDNQVRREDQRMMTGAAGSSFVVDTVRCFHRGSRIRDASRSRMVAVFQYVPVHCSQLVGPLPTCAPYHQLTRPEMPAIARAVLGEHVA
jgi:hypothetical protein